MNLSHIIASKFCPKSRLFSSARYDSFQEVLGADNNFSFIHYDDFVSGLKGESVEHLSYKNGEFIKKNTAKGLDIDVAMIEYYDAQNIEQKKKDMFEVIPYFSKQKGITLINSSESLYSQDKKFLFENQDLFSISPPKTYFFENKNEALDLISSNKDYIIKPRFGADSKGVEKLNINVLNSVSNIEDYIIQEQAVSLLGEVRLIFANDSFLGSRFILDRAMPWEKKSQNVEKDYIIPVEVGSELIHKAKQIHSLSKCEVSSVDFFLSKEGVSVNNLFDGNEPNISLLEKDLLSDPSNCSLVEVNGFGTGYGNYKKDKGPYEQSCFKLTDGSIGRLNKEVAQKVLDKLK